MRLWSSWDSLLPSAGPRPCHRLPSVAALFVQANCAKCHAVGRVGDSPLSIAPAFRTLHERYPVESLQEALAEGIVTGHPSMPEFSLPPDQVEAVIAYLKSLER